MAAPRVFVSSTYYDLKYIRENLKYFIKTIGYEPVLSEEGDIFYNPKQHTHESCLTEVPACQIFVLIIGGRYGGKFIEGEKSITNMEYQIAIESKVPVFALVESSVLAEHKVYNDNIRNNKKIKPEDISYPSVDNIKIFEFIDEVRKHAVNNATVGFNDFTDIETYLKKQWAGMMYSFLTEQIEEESVSDTLSEINKVNHKIEILTTQILKSVGKDINFMTVRLYEEMTSNESYRAITYFKTESNDNKRVKVVPTDFLRAKSFTELANNFNIELKVEADDYIISGTGGMNPDYFEEVENAFRQLRSTFESIMKEYGMNTKSYLAEIEK
ncbi:DUF4062 domain-containing protein [Fulvivirgaceae bacterium BMA12]|uniref:DUF4062 domain-containing protein n=1 Tax=Agaribacillus aureus TaxID=3051825 RepID=A0ABT8LDM0_9BACT|nr:DUF4062 domain-containing protein [Fulvivirgaceae bacterium BMA12]